MQFNPVLPLPVPFSVFTPLGRGWAHFLIFLGIEHHLVWVVIDDASGQIWQWENPDVRFDPNYTFGRPTPEKPKRITLPAWAKVNHATRTAAPSLGGDRRREGSNGHAARPGDRSSNCGAARGRPEAAGGARRSAEGLTDAAGQRRRGRATVNKKPAGRQR